MMSAYKCLPKFLTIKESGLSKTPRHVWSHQEKCLYRTDETRQFMGQHPCEGLGTAEPHLSFMETKGMVSTLCLHLLRMLLLTFGNLGCFSII